MKNEATIVVNTSVAVASNDEDDVYVNNCSTSTRDFKDTGVSDGLLEGMTEGLEVTGWPVGASDGLEVEGS